jgi:hypothetical protein
MIYVSEWIVAAKVCVIAAAVLLVYSLWRWMWYG